MLTSVIEHPTIGAVTGNEILIVPVASAAIAVAGAAISAAIRRGFMFIMLFLS